METLKSAVSLKCLRYFHYTSGLQPITFQKKNNQWDVSFVDNSISCWSYQLNLNLIISIESKFKEIVHSQRQRKVYAYDKFAVKLMAINNSAEKLKRVIMHDWISYCCFKNICIVLNNLKVEKPYTISFDLHEQIWRNRQNFYWNCKINNQVIHDNLLMFRASESSYFRKD